MLLLESSVPLSPREHAVMHVNVIFCELPFFFFLFSFPDKVDTVRNVLGRWGRKVGEATRKAETLAGNTWQHCKFVFVLCFFLINSCFVVLVF